MARQAAATRMTAAQQRRASKQTWDELICVPRCFECNCRFMGQERARIRFTVGPNKGLTAVVCVECFAPTKMEVA